MATNRKRTIRKRLLAGGITQVEYLFFSFGPFFEAEDYEVGKTEEELKTFYQKHRDTIMERFFRENSGAGKRPWSFWEYDMPEPQRKTLPAELDSHRVWDHRAKKYDWVEGEIEYLKRLGLLEAWEL
jgi:hypothetical protein